MINSAQQAGKYTQGFVFEHDTLNESYIVAVVERSCAAVVTLLKDVFALAEKTAFQEAAGAMSVREQNRAFARMADIIRYRPLIETALTTAAACAYADMTSKNSSGRDNTTEIEKRISELEALRCEKLDLAMLFQLDQTVSQSTDRNRPLLIELSAKLALLFKNDTKHIDCNPLSPATLISGYLAGLMCADMDILAKKILFRTFEQEFLSKLTLLMNSVILRLEQENLLVKRAVGFDDKNAGPIKRVLVNPLRVSASLLQSEIDALHKLFAVHKELPFAQSLYELSGEDSLDSTMSVISDIKYHVHLMQPSILRSELNLTERHAMIETRRFIVRLLNTEFSGKKMPFVVNSFLQSIWLDSLFDIAVKEGETSEAWANAMRLQGELVKSVTPEDTEENAAALNHLIPLVVKNLRRLLDESGCSLEAITNFFSELKIIHLQNMQQKLSADTFVAWTELPMESVLSDIEPALDKNEMLCYVHMRDMVSLISQR